MAKQTLNAGETGLSIRTKINDNFTELYNSSGGGGGGSSYTHPTGDGNSHVPATGTTNNGKVLKAGATAGSVSWGTLSASDVGLGNCDNTSDANKPVSTATQTALDGKAATNHTHPLSQLEQSSATNGQVPTWNGTAWVPATPASGGGSGGVTSYNQLTDRPTLGTAAATAASDYATAAQGTKADSALQAGADISAISGLQTALDGKQPAGSYATLDSNSKLTADQIPDLTITDFLGACANHTEMLAKTGQRGDWVTRADDGKVYVITGNTPSQASSWTALSYPVAPTQQNADWNAASGVAQILNKPTLGTAAATAASDYATAAQGAKADSALQSGALSIVFKYRGSYSSSSNYKVNDVVTEDGKFFLCIFDLNASFSDGRYEDQGPSSFGPFYWAPFATASGIGAAATSHEHGNITSAGAIGTTAALPVITGAAGVLQAGSFGTTAGTFCQGNDSRLSDSRQPTSHKSTHAIGGSDVVRPADIGAAAMGILLDGKFVPYSGIKNGKVSYYSLVSGGIGQENADVAWVGGKWELRILLPSGHATASYSSSNANTDYPWQAFTNIKPALNPQAQHNHSLSQLEQSSATNGQVATWNGTAWVPQTPASGGVTSYNQLTDRPSLGTAAATAASDYATAAQGAKADSALQSGAAISAISGLQTALDGKAAASHKSSHATGGADALAPADIGAEPTISTLPINKGGTGATTAAAARTNFSVPGSVITGLTGATQLTNIVQITQAGYNAIVTKDANTLYIITA